MRVFRVTLNRGRPAVTAYGTDPPTDGLPLLAPGIWEEHRGRSLLIQSSSTLEAARLSRGFLGVTCGPCRDRALRRRL